MALYIGTEEVSGGATFTYNGVQVKQLDVKATSDSEPVTVWRYGDVVFHIEETPLQMTVTVGSDTRTVRPGNSAELIFTDVASGAAIKVTTDGNSLTQTWLNTTYTAPAEYTVSNELKTEAISGTLYFSKQSNAYDGCTNGFRVTGVPSWVHCYGHCGYTTRTTTGSSESVHYHYTYYSGEVSGWGPVSVNATTVSSRSAWNRALLSTNYQDILNLSALSTDDFSFMCSLYGLSSSGSRELSGSYSYYKYTIN